MVNQYYYCYDYYHCHHTAGDVINNGIIGIYMYILNKGCLAQEK